MRRVEKHVIAHFPRADNRVASQQGLAVRRCAYSFLYVCRTFWAPFAKLPSSAVLCAQWALPR
eukprot:8980639-Pyramimonas_sp.AAC.1